MSSSLNPTWLCLFQNKSNLQVYGFFCKPFRCLKQSGDYCKNTWVLIVKRLLGQLCQFSRSDKILCAITELYIKKFLSDCPHVEPEYQTRVGDLFLQARVEGEKKGLHSSFLTVLIDVACLYKILQAVSSQSLVSKHTSIVCLQTYLSLRQLSPASLKAQDFPS